MGKIKASARARARLEAPPSARQQAAPSAEVVSFPSPRADRGQPLLGAVVCPLTAGELDAALANLALWDSEAPPIRREVEAAADRTRLIFSFNCAADPSLAEPLLTAYARSINVRRAFCDVEVRFCDLPPDKDRYERDPNAPAGPYGAKAGPNWLFYETLKALRGEARFVFLMETDCRPVKANWLKRLHQLCRRHEDAWILGAPYLGASSLQPAIARHINGNALYQVGEDRFWALFEGVLWPWLHQRIAEGETGLAYDCVWEAFLNRAEMADGAHPDWRWARRVMPRIRMLDFIANIAGRAEHSGQYLWSRRQVREMAPEALFIHGPLAADNRHRRGFANLGPVQAEGVVREGGELVVEPGGERTFARTVWLADHDLEPGQAVEFRAVVRSDFAFRLNLSFTDARGRFIALAKVNHPGVFEVDEPGASTEVRFVMTCERPTPYLHLVLSFMHLAPEPMRIGFDAVAVVVSRDGEELGRVRRVLD